MPHPNIVTFGRTSECQFPLLLVIGREPSCLRPPGKDAASFKLDHDPHYYYWNRAFAQMARLGGKPSSWFNQQCKKRGARPVIFADALGIKPAFQNPQKDALRRDWMNDPGKVARHIEKIFGDPILPRVALVVLNGLAKADFQNLRGQFEQKCQSKGIPFANLPSYGSCAAAAELDECLPDAGRQTARFIFEKFLEEPIAKTKS